MKTERELAISSYVVLGLLAMCGPQTPYELKKLVDGSIGYFWDFPRAQLYVDPERLAAQGYAEEEREPEGRRRRTYHVTESGVGALRAWLRDTTATEVELRDAGLLKLYFGFLLNQTDVVALAERERDSHRRRLSQYRQIKADLEGMPDNQFALTTLELGLQYEQLSIEFWEGVARHPPALPDD